MVDTMQLAHDKFAAFNVYKRVGPVWKKLTASPIPRSGNDRSRFIYFDNTSTPTQNVNYAFAMESTFGNEGKKTQYIYHPSEHPINHNVPQLAEVNSVSENFANGFNINWSFAKESEKLLKGFIVEKANLPQQYKAVSELLPTSQRTFTDKTFSPPASYVKLKVTALYKDEEQFSGNEKLVFYLPPISIPAPANVTGKWVRENDRTFIDLSWNARTPADSLIQEYHLYASDPFSDKLLLQSSLPTIKPPVIILRYSQ